MPRYTVFVDDNYHHGDESHRRRLGVYADADEALAVCKRIVDELLERADREQTADEMFAGYCGFGEDPWIATDDESCRFSAWEYARERCGVLARKPS